MVGKILIGGLTATMLIGCSGTADRAATDCADAGTIGRFDASQDLLISNFDIKTDVDDLHSAAALATILADPAYACVSYVAVHGTYGEQEGDFIPAPDLFDAAFGDNWIDAHDNKAAAADDLSARIIATLEDGGDVWIQEAGQSDVSAAAIRAAMAASPDLPYGTQVHIVQHADWNEEVTTDEDLAFVQETIDYIRMPDGNAVGNGSPGFRSESAEYWPALTGDARIGAVWQAAKDLGEAENPPPGYVNPAVEQGGIDFSDTVEAAYIFGFDDMTDTADFIARFIDAE